MHNKQCNTTYLYSMCKNLFTVEELDQHVTFPQRHHIGIHLPKKIQVSVSCLTLYVYFRTPCCVGHRLML